MIDSGAGVGRFKRLAPEPNTAEKVDQQFKEVSQMYEKHFMREMMKAMRSTVQESDFIKHNQAEKIFREQLDQEYVEKWGDRGGIGLSDLIYKQLVEKYGPVYGLKAPVEKPHGPIKLDEKSNLNKIIPQGKNTRLELSNPVDRQVTAPWSGYLQKKLELAPDEWFLQVSHENGLSSQMSFKGRAADLTLGQFLQGGDKVGLMSPDHPQLIWNLGPDLSLDTKSVSE